MNASNYQPKLPLTETTFYILLSLSPKPNHGYGILKEVEALSNERVILSTGTLYGALKRLLKQGWIERVSDKDIDNTGRQRKTYRLTTSGRLITVSEAERLQNLVKIAQTKLAREIA